MCCNVSNRCTSHSQRLLNMWQPCVYTGLHAIVCQMVQTNGRIQLTAVQKRSCIGMCGLLATAFKVRACCIIFMGWLSCTHSLPTDTQPMHRLTTDTLPISCLLKISQSLLLGKVRKVFKPLSLRHCVGVHMRLSSIIQTAAAGLFVRLPFTC